MQEVFIPIHGARNTGKTSLFCRMNGIPFRSVYIPTKMLKTSEIKWENAKIKLWDVVDKALPSEKGITNIELPDASNVDTIAQADGVIIMYNQWNKESIEYAASIIDKTPSSTPILVIHNMQDRIDIVYEIPEELKQRERKFDHIFASMRSNKGLVEISKWLSIPIKFNTKKTYANLLSRFESDKKEVEFIMKQLVKLHYSKFVC